MMLVRIVFFYPREKITLRNAGVLGKIVDTFNVFFLHFLKYNFNVEDSKRQDILIDLCLFMSAQI